MGRPLWRELPRVAMVTVLGSGLMVNTMRAATQMMRGRKAEFERTAKFGMDAGRANPTSWMRQRYQLRLDSIVFFEMTLGVYSLATARMALRTQTWGIMLYATLFGVGLLAVAAVSVAESIGVFRNRRRRAEQIRLERSRWEVAGAERTLPMTRG